MRMMMFGRQSPRGLLLSLLCLLLTCSAPVQGFLMPKGFETVDTGTYSSATTAYSSTTTASVLDEYFIGIMSPSDAYPLVGETLVMNCTLDRDKVKEQYTAHQLFFQPGTDIESNKNGMRNWTAAGLQTVLDNDTLQLTVPDMTREDSGHLYCKLQVEGQNPRHVMGGLVTVTAPPQLGNMTCISHNHRDLNCSFCPDVYPPDDYTIYDIKFSVTNAPWLNCSSNSPFHCHCYLCQTGCSDPYFTWFEDYRFRVEAKDIRRRVATREYAVKTDRSIVKTDPVVNLETSSIGSRVIEGHFEQPNLTAHLTLEYTLTVTNNNPALPNHTEILGANESFRVEGLHPYTRYQVSVISRVVQSPYFSDPAHIDIDTAVEAPGSGPPIPIGAMRKGGAIGELCKAENCHDFHVYWGMLEDELSHNGPLNGYNASLLTSDGKVIDEQDVGTASVYTATMIDRQAYTVCVSVYNTLNGTKLYSPSSCIERQPVSKMLANAEVWAEKLDDVIIMNIDAPADTNVTVFACEPVDSSLTDCEDPILSETIAGSVKQYNTSHKENFMYSVSASKDGAFSGMTDKWICFSAYNKPAGEVEKFSVEAPEERSLTATWKRRLCTVPNQEGRVLYYELYWECETGEEGNVTVAEDRSEYKISGLQPFSLCNVSIEAVARGGKGRKSLEQNRTKESAPGLPPQNVSISNVTTESFLVSYNPSPQPNGKVTNYRIIVKAGGTELINESTGLDHKVAGLQGYRNYSVEVVAVNNAGLSPPSQVVNEQTLIGVPSTIGRSDITANKSPSDANVVKVNWKAPAQPNGPIDHYIVQLRDSKGKEQEENVSGDVLSYDVTHPCEGEEVRVNVTVRAVNINEQGVKMEGQESPQPEEATACATPFPVAVVASCVTISVVAGIVVSVILIRKASQKTKESLNIEIEVPEDHPLPENEGNQNEAYVQDSGYPVTEEKKDAPLLQETSDSGRSGSLSTSPSLTSSVYSTGSNHSDYASFDEQPLDGDPSPIGTSNLNPKGTSDSNPIVTSEPDTSTGTVIHMIRPDSNAVPRNPDDVALVVVTPTTDMTTDSLQGHAAGSNLNVVLVGEDMKPSTHPTKDSLGVKFAATTSRDDKHCVLNIDTGAKDSPSAPGSAQSSGQEPTADSSEFQSSGDSDYLKDTKDNSNLDDTAAANVGVGDSACSWGRPAPPEEACPPATESSNVAPDAQPGNTSSGLLSGSDGYAKTRDNGELNDETAADVGGGGDDSASSWSCQVPAANSEANSGQSVAAYSKITAPQMDSNGSVDYLETQSSDALDPNTAADVGRLDQSEDEGSIDPYTSLTIAAAAAATSPELEENRAGADASRKAEMGDTSSGFSSGSNSSGSAASGSIDAYTRIVPCEQQEYPEGAENIQEQYPREAENIQEQYPGEAENIQEQYPGEGKNEQQQYPRGGENEQRQYPGEAHHNPAAEEVMIELADLTMVESSSSEQEEDSDDYIDYPDGDTGLLSGTAVSIC